ncbi:hypothetical protein [Hymenobacter sp. UYCo722]|uniref:hypothetical protein n=1 Tax=Hymenobacter sp. UYCo722 TaxID=3156335 RepID=UPI00339A4B20
MPSSFPFTISATDDSEQPFQLIAKFDTPDLAFYKSIFDKHSLSDCRVSLVDVAALVIEEHAPDLLDHLNFDEEGYWLDMYVDSEAAVQSFISKVCPIFQSIELLKPYVYRVAEERKI